MVTGVVMSRHLLNTALAIALSALMAATGALAGGLSEDESRQAKLQINRPSIDLEIRFEWNTADVAASSVSALNDLGEALSDPELKEATLMIAAYADAIDDPKSQDLALRRAESIKQYLVSNYKIAADHLVTSAIPGSADHRNRVRVINISDKPSGETTPQK